jgi:hypothetical protein
MNPLDRMPGPYPRGERGGIEAVHIVATFFGIALVLLAVVAVVLLLWNSFKVRAEVQALRSELARLGSGVPAAPTSPGVNAGTMAVPPSPPAAPPTSPPSASESQSTPATKAPATKPRRAPKKKPADPVE